MPTSNQDYKDLTDSQRVFVELPEEAQKLIKKIMELEREVMHLQRRHDLYKRLLDAVKEVIR
jgi:hypothetical protein